ncbi:MAG: type II toxin-antitoxin system prevent-host-death family antitoxin [Stigonema ocellatum SAG 48.90 = DSM 106950]|nr:type II toxin-antitoxin system prevent-host-death family antitoxin [Stigonema ocellatum SAG 48.90 = DSM 106950]
MSQQYSIEQIPVNFNKIIQEMEKGEQIEITQQGKQIGVIISTAEYEKLLNKTLSFWESIERFRQEYNVEAAEIDPDEIFARVRDKSPGRQQVTAMMHLPFRTMR